MLQVHEHVSETKKGCVAGAFEFFNTDCAVLSDLGTLHNFVPQAGGAVGVSSHFPKSQSPNDCIMVFV